MREDVPDLTLVSAGLQLTILGLVSLTLPLLLVDLSQDAFVAAGLLFAVAGTVLVAIGILS